MNREQAIAYIRQLRVGTNDPRHQAVATQSPQLSREEDKRRLQAEMDEAVHKFRSLLAKPTYNQMLKAGKYWQHARTMGAKLGNIQELSSANLYQLTRQIERIPPRYKPLMDRLRDLPYTLKHNTKPDYVNAIKKDRVILSLAELRRRGIAVAGGTQEADEVMIHNQDFVFFRLSLGNEPAHSRFGSECFVFRPDQLFKMGWLSLYDMLSPASTERLTVFPAIEKLGDLTNKRPAFMRPARTIQPDECTITHSYPLKRRPTSQGSSGVLGRRH